MTKREPAEERAAFEKWANSVGDLCDCSGDGTYLSIFTYWEWKSWQARGEYEAAQSGETVPAKWSLTIETLVGELSAVLHEPGKMDTATPILLRQLPWFNALRYLLGHAAPDVEPEKV